MKYTTFQYETFLHILHIKQYIIFTCLKYIFLHISACFMHIFTYIYILLHIYKSYIITMLVYE